MNLTETKNKIPTMKVRSPSLLGKTLPIILLVFSYFLVAAAGYSGFFLKWSFRDGVEHRQISYLAASEGTAERPWVYRQLLPLTVDAISKKIPTNRMDTLEREWTSYSLADIYVGARHSTIPTFVANYRIAYLLTFASFLSALFLLRSICLNVTKSTTAATAAPMLLALLYPILMTRGGYYYDPIELMMFSLATLFAIRGWWIALIALSPLAELNKEAFVFFLATLIPLAIASKQSVRGYISIAISMALALATYGVLKHAYAMNPGGAVEFHFFGNLQHYMQLRSYFGFEITYGLRLPSGLAIVNIIIFGAIVFYGWPSLPKTWRRHALAALAVNSPLFLLFAWADEIRNLSLTFVSLTILIASGLTYFVNIDGNRQLDTNLTPQPR